MRRSPYFREAWKRPFFKRIAAYRSRITADAIPCDLNDPDWFSLFQAPCHYCGEGGGRLWNELNGVDRIEWDMGYVRDNVVACCAPCNYMKGRQSYDEFIARCRQIARRDRSSISQKPSRRPPSDLQ